MKISDYTIQFLGNFIAGDIEGFPYRSGFKLVEFFNGLGSKDVYPSGGGFPTRRIYAQDKVRELNGKPRLNDCISKALDPREFGKSEKTIEDAISLLNKNLEYDGYEVVREGRFYKVRELTSSIVRMGVEAQIADDLTKSLIDENIRKCESKLGDGDYSGAITNARSLVESVCSGIEKELDSSAQSYDGDLGKLYKRVQRLLNIEPNRKDIAEPLKQVLSGLESVVHGLASLRNKMSDAHVTTYPPSRHHAKLAVYSAITLADFLFETKNYQQLRGTLKKK
ncbi:MAG: abortive infection family protein [Magnetococcales bacterium]|nr:abortive infection family protein [Magnetococcales bacterium]